MGLSQHHLLGLFVALAAGSAAAQPDGVLRWRTTPPLGLQAGQGDVRLPCGRFSFSCDSATLPLYISADGPRSLSLQMGYDDTPALPAPLRAGGMNLSLVGKAGLGWDLGVYGSVGTTLNRRPGALAPLGPGEGGLRYGVGLSWDFSRSGSAALGLDRYDVRSGLGDTRELRGSLGLQWRY